MTRFRNLSITDRLLIGFGLMLVILVGALGVTRMLFTNSAAIQNEITQRISPQSQAARELEQAILYVGIGVRGYLLVGGAAMRERHEENLRTVRTRLDALTTLTRDEASSLALLARADSAARSYLTLADSLVGAASRFDGTIEAAMNDKRERALVPLREFGASQRERHRGALDRMATSRLRVEQGLVIALIAALALALVVAWVTSSSIRTPTRQLLDIAERMQRGEWDAAHQLAGRFTSAVADPSTHRNELLRIASGFGIATVALEQRDQRLQSTNAVAAATASSLDRHEVASAVLQAVCEHLGAEIGAVYVRDHSDDSLRPVATRALPDDLPTLRPHEGIPGEAAASGRTVTVREIPADTPFQVRVGFDSLRPRTIVAVPFAFDRKNLGVLLVASVRDISPADVRFLEAAANQLGVGVANVRAYETVQQLLAEVEQQREQIAEQLEQLQGQHEELQVQHEEIQAQGEELQAQSEEIQSQNEELQAQASSLIEADEQKNRFLGLLAHELRNPMAAISNSLFLLAKADGDHSISTRARSIIERQTKQLTRLVDDLLDITRIASGKLHIERSHIDLASIVRDCVDDHRATAEAQGITLDCVLPETTLPVHGDSARLRQVVGNLVDNAIKFCAADGNIRVWCYMNRENEVVLSVSDDGIGIDPSLQAQLFKPFMQADPTRTRSRGGLGLGLSLVRAYVTLHGGSVTLHSAGTGKGCEFVVVLPASQSQPSDGRSRVEPDAALLLAKSPRRVLVVEDDADGAESLRAALQLDGHDVRIASSVDDALALASSFVPDVALCDVGLPGTDGYEFARRARMNEQLGTMRIVALTGYAAPDDKQRAVDAGFDSHITKPASMNAIRSLLDSMSASN